MSCGLRLKLTWCDHICSGGNVYYATQNLAQTFQKYGLPFSWASPPNPEPTLYIYNCSPKMQVFIYSVYFFLFFLAQPKSVLLVVVNKVWTTVKCMRIATTPLACMLCRRKQSLIFIFPFYHLHSSFCFYSCEFTTLFLDVWKIVLMKGQNGDFTLIKTKQKVRIVKREVQKSLPICLLFYSSEWTVILM